MAFSKTKLFIVPLMMLSVLILFGCESNEEYSPETFDTYYDYLEEQGKSYELKKQLDYQFRENGLSNDDEREIINVDNYEESDLINIESESLKNALQVRYDFQDDITLSEALQKETMSLPMQAIKSLEGIEYFKALENVDLANNFYLDSINGLQTLEQLRHLDIRYTSVTHIDYSFGNLQTLNLSNTPVDLNVELLASLLENNEQLNQIDGTGSQTFLDQDLYDFIMEVNQEGRNLRLLISPYQIDFNELSIEDFYEIDYDADNLSIEWMNLNINVEFLLEEHGNPETIRYMDLFKENYFDEMTHHLNNLDADIGIDDTKDDLEKMVLIYAYMLEINTIDEEGSEDLIDALKGNDVTYDTLSYALVMVYRYYGVQASFSEYEFDSFPEGDSVKGSFINVDYQGQMYMIYVNEKYTYEYFMIGFDVFPQLLESKAVDMNENFLRERTPSYSLQRDKLQEALDALNIVVE